MRYNTIGIMSGSSLDGIDIVNVEFYHEIKEWKQVIIESECYPYSKEWEERLSNLHYATAFNYQLAHHELGKYIGECVNDFIDKYKISKKELLIGSHGHTIFHEPSKGFTSQIGCGATISAKTNCTTISDLRIGDVAMGGQGAPIVPIGEQHLWPGYTMYLNIGGIANISVPVNKKEIIAYDICSANRVLNLLANKLHQPFDNDGLLARNGHINKELLIQLNEVPYYQQAYPKTLNNTFGTDYILNLISTYNISIENALHTYTEHVAIQVANVINIHQLKDTFNKVMCTGGGALNLYLIQRIHNYLQKNIQLEIPGKSIIAYKEAIIMAFIGLLRVLNKTNVLSSVTGSKRNTSNGCIWNV